MDTALWAAVGQRLPVGGDFGVLGKTKYPFGTVMSRLAFLVCAGTFLTTEFPFSVSKLNSIPPIMPALTWPLQSKEKTLDSVSCDYLQRVFKLT